MLTLWLPSFRAIVAQPGDVCSFVFVTALLPGAAAEIEDYAEAGSEFVCRTGLTAIKQMTVTNLARGQLHLEANSLGCPCCKMRISPS